VQLILVLVAAVVVLMVLGFVINALKWLLIIAALLLAVAVLAGWRPGSRSTYR
jgi:hypothetical protein